MTVLTVYRKKIKEYYIFFYFLFLQTVKTVTLIFRISQSLEIPMIILFLLEPILKSSILERFFCVLVRSFENVALHLD